MNFSLFKSRKRGELTAGDDVRTGPGSELTWHAGPARGCDVALRPCGKATAGPHEAQVAPTRGKRPHGRVHLGSREGRHVASKDGRWRAHEYGGPWLSIWGGNANALPRPPI